MSTRAKKELGQHFLADENIVAVAGRMAELGPGDVVLEVGPGLGVLTTHLADRVRLVHAIEIDPSLEPGLRERIGARRNVELVFADALRHPLAKLDPPPTKFVSNLPYNVATPLIVESLDGLASVEHWTVMVQREVADRLLVETDSPYLAPQAVRGRPNEPANVLHTLAVVASARGEDQEELGHKVDANAAALFGLP